MTSFDGLQVSGVEKCTHLVTQQTNSNHLSLPCFSVDVLHMSSKNASAVCSSEAYSSPVNISRVFSGFQF